jgi:predicted RNA methylase
MTESDQDAFGKALYACFRAGETGISSVIERDDGLVDVEETRVYFAPFHEWRLHEQQAISLVRGRVLDIGCGAGRHALHLQQQGFDVLGVDVSPLALEVCRLRGVDHTALMSVSQLGSRLGQFDTVLMMGNNFGLFASFRRARWLLRRFYGMTSAQVRIIAQTLDPYQTDLPEHLKYHELNRRRGRAGGQVRIRVRYRQYRGPWFDYLFVSKPEMQELLCGTGWAATRFLDSEGPVYVAVLEKSLV